MENIQTHKNNTKLQCKIVKFNFNIRLNRCSARVLSEERTEEDHNKSVIREPEKRRGESHFISWCIVTSRDAGRGCDLRGCLGVGGPAERF